jgi:CRISPR-associated endonuclease/helicase Cas3
MSVDLDTDEFPVFFEAVHGYPPFPWQATLVCDLAKHGRWPDVLDLPTGAGKTAAIDAAVFHLALEADRGEARTAPLRIAFVVDRRLVVDDAFERAQKIAVALADPGAPAIVRRVAERLKRLAGPHRRPLVVAKLRGGAPREDDWAKTPCQPTVLCSTVDQVGSRLLFRGYGVSDRMKPIHAGLLGSDALILLDEAHLSEPFRQTAKDISGLDALHGPDPRPLRVALLTATPGADKPDEWRFGLNEMDLNTPRLSARINATKPAVFKEATDKGQAGDLAKQAMQLVTDLQAAGIAAPVVGVVANRIGRARDAYAAIANSAKGNVVTLIIGRARDVDREAIAASLDDIKTGYSPRPSVPRIIVATQTIEAGVDIDLDALVTDAASLDALRQRFGRLNRDGRPGLPAKAVVIAEKADRKPKKDGDPVYGAAIANTLAALWPTGQELVDFGSAALDRHLTEKGLIGDAVLPLLAEKPDAPVLMPAYVDLWNHTAPIPACDPEPGLFLHGPKREPAAVQVVWRADVADLIRDLAHPQLRELMRIMPPRAAETLELPVYAAKAWLAKKPTDLADVAERVPEIEGADAGQPVFRWRGGDDERSVVIDASALRAGDLIVVPSAYGGCDQYGWNPKSEGGTPDVAEAAAEPYAGRRFVVRIAPGLIRQALAKEQPHMVSEALDEVARRIADRVETALHDLGDRPTARETAETLKPIVPDSIAENLTRLLKTGQGLERPSFPYNSDISEDRRPGVVIVAARGLLLPDSDPTGTSLAGNASTEDDAAGSFVGKALSLVEHSRDVEHFAAAFAQRAGLPTQLAADLALAGWLHDAGKADPRFQALLSADRGFFAREEVASHGTDSVLAKSAKGASPPGAWERAGLPPGWRHEALSVRLALENPRLQTAHDRALVLWLVGTHHGLGRPFFDFRDPVSDGDQRALVDLARVPGLSDLDLRHGIGPERLGFAFPEDKTFAPSERDREDLRGLDWHTLFRNLRRRYGAWRLALLEATLRLADHRASEAAQDGNADGEEAA